MILLPIGRDDAVIQRHAWVSYTMIALNVLVWFAVAVFESTGGNAAAEQQWQQTMRYYVAHPYLEVPPSIAAYVPATLQARIKASDVAPPASVDVRAEQSTFDVMAEHLTHSIHALPRMRFAYVPTEGGVLRLIASMFMHAGFMHLFGNMLFFFVTGPFVEDVFGRPLFAFLYVSGGIAATLTFAAKHAGSTTPLVGASGAIAAVMGAYLVRFVTSRVEFIFIPFLFRPMFNFRFYMPAFIVLPLWFAQQFFLTAGETSGGGVAFSAHVGGFLYGVAIAGIVKLLRIEEKFVAPVVEKQTTWKADERLVQAMSAQAAGNLDGARAGVAALLRDQPRDVDALRFAVETAEDDVTRDACAVRLLNVYIEEKQDDLASGLVRELEAARLPHFMTRAAQYVERRGDRDWALTLYESLCEIENGGANGVGSLVKLGTLRKLAGDARGAREAFTRARQHPDCSPDWAASVDAKLQQLA